MEAYPSKGIDIAAHDISRPGVILALESNIKAGCFSYIHFGLPCTSWSSMQMMNGGSRRSWIPEGDGSKLTKWPSLYLGFAGCSTIPEASSASRTPERRTSGVTPSVEALLGVACDVDFDQCMYGLTPPHITNNTIRKAIRIRTNLELLN